jgi:hypothetical protein
VKPLAPPEVFARRLLASTAVGLALVIASLVVGMAGYHGYEGLPWIDAFLNAAMILSGMGPLMQPATTGGKLFAGIYALYSGLAVLVIAGVIFGPVVHRFLHRFHIEAKDD